MAESKGTVFNRDKQRKSSEFQGEIPVSYRPNYILSAWILGICVILICIWGVCGRISENVFGGGMITHYAQFTSVVSPGDGVLISLDVQVGDRIQRGQIIGRIFSEQDLEEFLIAKRLLEDQQKTYEIILAHVNKIKAENKSFTKEEQKRIDASMQRLQEQLNWGKKFLADMDNLTKKGAISQLQFMQMLLQYNEGLNQQEAFISQKFSKDILLMETLFRLEDTLLEYELSAMRARYEAEQKMRAVMLRTRIVSVCHGEVVNVNVSGGTMLKKGQELLRVTDMRSDEERAWCAYCYIPLSDAKKIRPGMAASVTPSTVKAEQDGSICGTVVEVEQTVTTRDALMAQYHSDSFCEYVFTQCENLPVKVKIMLSRNKDNPSGFNWTSGCGPDIRLSSETLCSVKVTTKYDSPAEIFFGKVRHQIFGSGVMEEKKGFTSTPDEGK